MSEKELLEKMSLKPAQILRTHGGTLREGQPADLMLYKKERWTVDPEELHGRSKNTPFKGLTLGARVKLTICGGKIVYNELTEE